MFDADYSIGHANDVDRQADLHRAWLRCLCDSTPQAQSAFLVFSHAAGTRTYTYPEFNIPPLLLDVAVHCERIDTCPIEIDNILSTCVICPAPREHEIRFASAAGLRDWQVSVGVIFPRLSDTESTALARLIHESFAWHGLLHEFSHLEDFVADANSPNSATQLITRALKVSDPSQCANILTGNYADRFHCERVILTISDGSPPKFLSVSGVQQADAKQTYNFAGTTLLKELAATDKQNQLVSMHDPRLADYAKRVGCSDAAACTHQTSDGTNFGLIFEQRDGKSIPHQSLSREFDSLIAPALEILALKLAASMSLPEISKTRFRSALAGVIGGENLRTKVITACVVLVALLACLVPLEFRIAAPVELEGASQRSIVAPFESHLSAVHASAGMSVSQDQVIAELDTSKLELERDKWRSEKLKLQREYNRALAELEQAEAQIIRAQIEQAHAELNLVDQQIEKSILRAPFDGVVITGDLKRSIGAPFEQGQALFEVAPLDDYRAILSIDERDIDRIATTQTGDLVLNAFPNIRWAFEVTSVTNAVPTDMGERVFRVRAQLKSPSDQLRPGMEGLGKILVGEESAAFIATRRFIGWLRLKLWAHLP